MARVLGKEFKLADFYNKIVQMPLAGDYKFIILALVRDADNAGFYSDIARYWFSLDDVTGSHILFAVADEATARCLQSPLDDTDTLASILRDGRFSSDSLTGQTLIDDRVTFGLSPKGNWRSGRPRRAKLSWDPPSEQMAAESTKQISELRDLLGLPESALPCLHVTLLGGPIASESWHAELRTLGSRSVYTFVKELMERMAAELAAVDHMLRQMDRHPSVATKDRFAGFPAFMRRKAGATKPQAPSHIGEQSRKAAVDTPEWARLRERFEALRPGGTGNSQNKNWDYFVSYAAADREQAEDVAAGLLRYGSVFLDNWCLRPGDDWPKEIPGAQEASRTLIALITRNTKEAFFQNEEIQRGINLMRAGRQRIVPIVAQGLEAVPFGLEIVQRVTWDFQHDVMGFVGNTLMPRIAAAEA
jgi:hypothetical protein